MKSIHYDSEGDILTVKFIPTGDQPTRGVELNDNVVLYYNPKTKEPVELILVSYQAVLRADDQKSLRLDGLTKLPVSVRNLVLRMIRRPPVSDFLELRETRGNKLQRSYPTQVFTSHALKAVA